MFIPQLHCSLELSPCAAQATLGDSYFKSHGCYRESYLHMADVTWLCISPRITECPCPAKRAFAFPFAPSEPVSGLQPGTGASHTDRVCEFQSLWTRGKVCRVWPRVSWELFSQKQLCNITQTLECFGSSKKPSCETCCVLPNEEKERDIHLN